MAEKPQNLIQNRHQTAVEKVKAALEKDTSFQPITPTETGERLKECSAVWRKTVETPDRSWVVDVGLPPFFPDEVPVAYLPAWEEAYLKLPHVGADGFICTIPDSAAIDSNDPVALVRYVFEDCQRILCGAGNSDFQAEFSSYWTSTSPKPQQIVVTVDPPSQLPTLFPAVFSKNCVYVASTIDQINSWVSKKSGEKADFKNGNLGVLISTREPLIPEQYPKTLAELVSLAEKCDGAAASAIKSHLAKNSQPGLVLFAQKESEGTTLGGVVFQGLNLLENSSVKLTHGFRPGRVPPEILYQRGQVKIGNRPVTRIPFQRVDHKWIHSRGGDGTDLSGKSVIVIGCGSLGGYVAQLLSRVGIGKLTLVDHDTLRWDNLGRHILGSNSVGGNKAIELTRELSKQLPHLEIKGIPQDWRRALVEDPHLFADKDLIVSTVADWRCERPLNEMIYKAKLPPVLFGWLEPHAVAGHCLTVIGNGGCFECCVDRFGRFEKAVAQFEKTPLAKEPGGCTYFQHYGPVALVPVASMIAASVVDSLLLRVKESRLQTWINAQAHFRSVLATLTDEWKEVTENAGYSRLYSRSWRISDNCQICVNRT